MVSLLPLHASAVASKNEKGQKLENVFFIKNYDSGRMISLKEMKKNKD